MNAYFPKVPPHFWNTLSSRYRKSQGEKKAAKLKMEKTKTAFLNWSVPSQKGQIKMSKCQQTNHITAKFLVNEI